MRILIATCVTPTTGGVASHIDTLAGALRKAGHDVTVVTPLGEADSFRVVSGSLSRSLSRFLRLPGGMLSAYWASQAVMRYRLKRTLQLRKYDVVNAEDVSAMNALLSLSPNIRPPAVLTVHGYLAAEAVADFKTRAGSLTHRFLLREEEMAYNGAVTIATCQERLAEHVATVGRRERSTVRVIWNFVDIERFNAAAADRRAVRTEMGIGHDEFVVLCPRRLVSKDGAETLVSAVSIMISSGDVKRPRALIMGTGHQVDLVRRLATALGVGRYVTLLGTVPNADMPRLYIAADAVAIPSVTAGTVVEGTSVAALEAMACGVPVVASSLGGLREVIEHEATGLLVPEGDPQALASALARLSRDAPLRDRLRNGSVRYARTERSAASAAAAFVRLYTEALQLTQGSSQSGRRVHRCSPRPGA